MHSRSATSTIATAPPKLRGQHPLGMLVRAWIWVLRHAKSYDHPATLSSRAHESDVLASLSEAVFVTDEQRRVTLWNEPLERLSGYSAGEALGSDVLGVLRLTESDFKQHESRSGERHDVAGNSNPTLDCTRKNGTTVALEGTIARVLDHSGRHTGFAGVFRAPNERSAMEAALRQADRVTTVGTLAGGVVHEINTPLAYITGNLEFVLRELHTRATTPDTEALTEALEDASHGAIRIAEIMGHLKTFACASSTGTAIVDLKRVVESAAAMLINQVKHRAQLVIEFAPFPGIEANEACLGQVFLNILLNAVQAIPAGDAAHNAISIMGHLDARGRAAVVSISDTGCGIPPRHLAQVFDPYFTTKPVGQGSGLGLSMSQSIVSEMGGTIEIESKLGSGTKVRVMLPLEAPKRERT